MNFYVGMMDDFRRYDHALTEEELQAVLAGAGAGYPLAMSPAPKDGAMLDETWANLTWRPGSFAVTHDFCFGTRFVTRTSEKPEAKAAGGKGPEVPMNRH